MGGPICLECAIGRYNDLNQQSACKSCLPGYYTNATGTLECKYCEGGRYSSTEESIACDLCGLGFYGDQLEQTGELNAIVDMELDGWDLLESGETIHIHQELEEDPNFWIFSKLSPPPFPDPTKSAVIAKKFVNQVVDAGHYSPDSCLGCVAGMYGDQLGRNSSDSCKQCPWGTWDNETGQSVCENCTEGRFSAKLGQTSSDTCLDCGRKARCIDGVCEKNFDPDSGCTVCLRFHFGKDCWVCPPAWQSYLQDALLMSVGVYFLFSMLYVLYRTEPPAGGFKKKDGKKKSKVKVMPESKKERKEEDKSDNDEEESEEKKEGENKESDEKKENTQGGDEEEKEAKDFVEPFGHKDEDNKNEDNKDEEDKEDKDNNKDNGETPKTDVEQVKEKDESDNNEKEDEKTEDLSSDDEGLFSGSDEENTLEPDYQATTAKKDDDDATSSRPVAPPPPPISLTIHDFEEDREISFAKKMDEEQRHHREELLERSKRDKTGTAMRRITVNQMQLLSAILPAIQWSDCLPDMLVRILDILGNLFSVDITQLITSPQCGTVQTTVRQQWLLRALMPLILAGVLGLWALMIKCWLRNKYGALQSALLTILRISVRLLLLGLYKTAVLTSLTILSCEWTEHGTHVLAMDQLPCPYAGGPDMYLAILGIVFVVVYGVFPYGTICCKLCSNGKPGADGKRIEKNSSGYVVYGWAASGYHQRAYLWESFNAMVIIFISAGSELIEGELRMYAHAGVAAFSMIMHILFRPYEDWSGNLVVIFFSITLILGSLGETEFTSGVFTFDGGRRSCKDTENMNGAPQSSDDLKLELQWAMIGMLIFTLLAVIWFGLTAAVNEVKRKQAVLMAEESEDASTKKDKTKKGSTKLARCERFMLLPFLILVAIPSLAISIPLFIASCVIYPFNQCTRLGQHATEVVEVMAVFHFLHRVVRSVYQLTLWPIYIICFVSAHTEFRGVVDSLAWGSCLEVLGRFIYRLMFPSYEVEEEEEEFFHCDHPLCNFNTDIKMKLLRHHRVCQFARPFKCKQCGYRAAEEEHIEAHTLEMHTVEEDPDDAVVIDGDDDDVEHEIHVIDDDFDHESMEMSIVDSDEDDEPKKKKKKKKKKSKKKKKKKKKKKSSKSKEDKIVHQAHDTIEGKKLNLKATFQAGHAAHVLSGHTILGDDLFGSDDEDDSDEDLFFDDKELDEHLLDEDVVDDGAEAENGEGKKEKSSWKKKLKAWKMLEKRKDPEKVEELKELVESGEMNTEAYKAEIKGLDDLEDIDSDDDSDDPFASDNDDENENEGEDEKVEKVEAKEEVKEEAKEEVKEEAKEEAEVKEEVKEEAKEEVKEEKEKAPAPKKGITSKLKTAKLSAGFASKLDKAQDRREKRKAKMKAASAHAHERENVRKDGVLLDDVDGSDGDDVFGDTSSDDDMFGDSDTEL